MTKAQIWGVGDGVGSTTGGNGGYSSGSFIAAAMGCTSNGVDLFEDGRFEPVPGDAEAVKLTVYACNAQAVTCDSTNFTAGDGNGPASPFPLFGIMFSQSIRRQRRDSR